MDAVGNLATEEDLRADLSQVLSALERVSLVSEMEDHLRRGYFRRVRITALVALAIMILVEINALVGTPGKGGAKPLATIKGTLWFGFVLTLVYYVWFMIMQ